LNPRWLVESRWKLSLPTIIFHHLWRMYLYNVDLFAADFCLSP
jgi:hypothetical protein